MGLVFVDISSFTGHFWFALDFLLHLGKNRHNGELDTGASFPLAIFVQQGLDGCSLVSLCSTQPAKKFADWISAPVSTSLLNGLPFYILVINIPQRFQTVNDLSPISTGIRLLSFTLVASIGGIIANLSVASGRIPVLYVALFFSATTAIGTGLLTTLPTDDSLPKAVYAYEALAGLGGGATFALVILLVPYVVERRDLGMQTGAS